MPPPPPQRFHTHYMFHYSIAGQLLHYSTASTCTVREADGTYSVWCALHDGGMSQEEAEAVTQLVDRNPSNVVDVVPGRVTYVGPSLVRFTSRTALTMYASRRPIAATAEAEASAPGDINGDIIDPLPSPTGQDTIVQYSQLVQLQWGKDNSYWAAVKNNKLTLTFGADSDSFFYLTQYPNGFTLRHKNTLGSLYYQGGECKSVLLAINSDTSNPFLWTFGGKEGWGAYALQSFAGSGQNLDGLNHTDGSNLTTRGWRHGEQMELTWIPQPPLPSSASAAIERAVLPLPSPRPAPSSALEQTAAASSSAASAAAGRLQAIPGDYYLQWGKDGSWWATVTDDALTLSQSKSSDSVFSFQPVGSSYTIQHKNSKAFLYYQGGESKSVLLVLNSDTSNPFLWTFGGKEGWGAYALQSFADSGQNLDGLNHTDGSNLTTRGWRHGEQMELTWIPSR